MSHKPVPEPTLDLKLDRIRRGSYTPADFIIADAKDGDMALGLGCPGPASDGRFKSKADYLQAMEAMTRSGLVDIMLMSVSSAETLVQRELFASTAVTPAVRMNDTTDIWMARGSRYRQSASMPYATADLESAARLCRLGLYSMTFSNDVRADRASLVAYREFRLAARAHAFQHFLEVFNPAFDIGIAEPELGFYINDMILKAVSGLVSSDMPRFLKLQFNGREAMAELCRYDPENLIVGILGGSQGTTRDTFELAVQAEQAGARVALFGRKINLAEAPLELVRLMREAIEQRLSAEQAVEEYHRYLSNQQIAPQRSLSEDQVISDPVLRG